MRLKLCLIKRKLSLIIARIGTCLIIFFCDLNNVLVLISILYDYAMVLSWPCLMFVFCAINCSTEYQCWAMSARPAPATVGPK